MAATATKAKGQTTIGPNGEKRPRDVIANAVHVCRVLAGLDKEQYVEERPETGKTAPPPGGHHRLN